MKYALLMVILVVATPALGEAQTQTQEFRAAVERALKGIREFRGEPVEQAKPAAQKHYLNLGADPQDLNRQLKPNEEFVVVDDDICDSGVGSGSGKKSGGCYHKGTTIARDKTTHVAIWVAFCGNDLSDKHVVNGKVISTEVVTSVTKEYVPVATPAQAPQIDWDKVAEIVKAAVASMPPPQVTVNPQVIVNLPPKKSHTVRNWLIAGAAGGATAAIIMATRDHSRIGVVSVMSVPGGG